MRIRALRIGCFLAVGAVLNMAVAWTCALSCHGNACPYDEQEVLNGRFGAHGLTWSVQQYERPGESFLYEFRRMAEELDPYPDACPIIGPKDLPRWSVAANVTPNEALAQHAVVVLEFGSGFPARSMHRRYIQHDGETPDQKSSTGIELDSDPGHQMIKAIPIIPIWPGFAINTLFYAAIAWGLWQVPLAIRRRRRRSLNRCVKCGYDLNGLAAGAACPECAHPRA
jgi:hypothetical protein